jgi:two-component system phosphate regulon sensor histidine kinase PhoR
LIPLVFAPLGLYLSSSLKGYFIKRLEENLFVQCRILIDQLPYLDKEKNLDEFARQLKTKTNTRVTIISNDGTVLGDSDKPSASMDNHLQRPEIQQAMLRESGTSIRFSNTIKKDMLYLAIPVWQDKEIKGFLRLAHPMTDIENTLYEIREKIILASFLALTISVIIGLYLSGSITRRIKKIVEVSRDIAMGNLKRKTLIPSEDEIGELEKNLNIMAEELETKMQTLAREKQTLETVFNTMKDGLLVIDGKGNIINASPAINRIFGISEDIKGRPYFEILRDPAAQDAMEEVRDTGKSAMREIEIFYPTYRYLYITVTPLQSNILGAGSIVVVHDITKIKHLETVRKDFVANVSHELRTPITAIKGFVETLLEGSIEDKKNARRHLEIIKNHSERLNSLVEDLLTLSRLDKGEFHLNPEEIDLRDIIDMVFITLKDKAVSKDISLLKEIPEDISLTADRNALTQIFLNLIDNAIKFTEFGRVLIRVESKDDTIEISVEDTGIGIEPQHIPRLGERFYRVDSARSRALGGTGLGLAIVKHLVHLHGWQMKINSVPGKGTKVILIIPRTEN